MAATLLRFFRHNAIALIALFVALSSTAYAAASLAPNTVGTKQLKKNAVVSAKVKNNSLTGADVRESSLGKVPKAATADSAPYIDSLPAGKTLRGAWGVRGADARQYSWISFGHRTAAPTTFHFIAPSATPPSECPGSLSDPQAQAGNTCVYANNVFNLGGGTMAFNEAFDPETATVGKAGRDGVILFFTNTTGDGAAYGTWAVTGS